MRRFDAFGELKVLCLGIKKKLPLSLSLCLSLSLSLSTYIYIYKLQKASLYSVPLPKLDQVAKSPWF